ncbi:MAG: MBOAT family protein [Phycisphaerae bacterium]
MLFQTSEYAILLTSVLLALVLVRTRTLQHVIILIASWIFYMSWDPIFIILLLYCTFNDYFIGIAIGAAKTQARKNFWLVVSLFTNLGVLAVFKYANFCLDSVNDVLTWLGYQAAMPAVNIVLPVGISFYTFHSMGYNIDVYRGKTPAERSFLRFAIYVAYFPQLVAGPILRAGQFLPQLSRTITFDAENLRRGANLFLVGLVKKVVVADNVAPLADNVFNDPQGLPSAVIWLGVLAFGVQIYCDFSGYTDMARGTSRMLGIEIPINFNYPYMATTITDFWRRWHISLSSWLRDYLYIPLGGNRHGVAMTYRNLMLTMGLGGLWHGAAWNFVIWGLYQGVLLSAERLFNIGEARPVAAGAEAAPPRRASGAQRALAGARTLLAWLICQYFVYLGWLLFRVHSASDLVYCVRKYVVFDFDFRLAGLGVGNVNPFFVISMMILFFLIHVTSYRLGGLANVLDRLPRWGQWSAACTATFALLWFWPEVETAFIYFQF